MFSNSYKLSLTFLWLMVFSFSVSPIKSESEIDEVEIAKRVDPAIDFQIEKSQRIGLHVTLQELSIWRKRAVDGPYKKRGDAGMKNTPGDYDRILKNANAFIKDPSSDYWNIADSGDCVPRDCEQVPKHHGEKIRDAAFVYLITHDISYSHVVQKSLIKLASEPNLDFSNQLIWCHGTLHDLCPSFQVCEWLLRLLFAYDYIKQTLTEKEKDTIENWFLKAALFFQSNVDADLDKLFIDRRHENYEPSKIAIKGGPGSQPIKTHYNGYPVYSINRWYNNRRSSQIRFTTLVGILTKNQALITSGKRFVKEWIRFSVYPNGLVGEFNRGNKKRPEAGWFYSMYTLTHCLNIADALARIGDMELYNFTTTNGVWGSEGKEKSLLLVIRTLCQLLDGSYYDPLTKSNKIYVYDKANGYNSEHFLIDGKSNNTIWVFDHWLAQFNIFYQDPYIKNSYLRTGEGCISYESHKIASMGPHHPWGGVWNVYPGKLFMFGQMEGKVWPYPVGR